MAALDISRVVELTNKAQRLVSEGHYGHAAAKYGAAIEAARALGPAAGEDCLIVTALMLRQAGELQMHALITESLPDSDSDEVLRFAFCTLLPAAQGALLRRKAAGTLLGGACRPHEVAWQVAFRKQAAIIAAKHLGLMVTPDWSPFAPHVGYDTFLVGAHVALNLLASTGASTLNGLQLPAHVAFVTDAFKLMALPRRGRSGSHALTPSDCGWTGEEATLVTTFLKEDVRGGFDTDTEDGMALLAAWHALQRSLALEERGGLLTDGVKHALRATVEAKAVGRAAAAPERLRVCALGSCGVRETYPAQYKLCAACTAAAYCSREHQVAHWAEHKAACKAARAAKGAAKHQ